MRFQTAIGPTDAEKVFRVARNSFTKTATITAASFVRGNPVILTAASASNNGYDIRHPDTAGETVNELYIGNVHDYPDTSIAQTGVWQPEATGWVQCYGYDDDAVVANATDTQAACLILVPTTGSRLVTIAQLRFGDAATGTANNSARSGVAGLAVLYQTVATSSAAGTTAAKVFLRCM